MEGADIVDGTPVLDIKPYLPEYDSVPTALHPAWFSKETMEDELTVSDVKFTASTKDDLMGLWKKAFLSNRSQFDSFDEFFAFVRAVLSQDIRSIYRRMNDAPNANQYKLVVEDIEVQYFMDSSNIVTIFHASCLE